MQSLRALSAQISIPANVGHKSGLYLRYQENKGWSLIRLNCLQQIFRWLGFYSSTRLKTVIQQIRKEADAPQALLEKVQAAWEKKRAAAQGMRPDGVSGIRIQAGGAQIVLKAGDITREEVEAIVNAANPACLGGNGVDGAIHRAAGPALLAECSALPEIRPNVRCETGSAVITGKGNLPHPIRFVIHAVGPVWNPADPDGSMALLKQTYIKCLETAAANGVRSMAFPAISAGIYGFGIERSVKAAFGAFQEYLNAHPGQFQEIRLDVLAPSIAVATTAAREFCGRP